MALLQQFCTSPEVQDSHEPGGSYTLTVPRTGFSCSSIPAISSSGIPLATLMLRQTMLWTSLVFGSQRRNKDIPVLSLAFALSSIQPDQRTQVVNVTPSDRSTHDVALLLPQNKIHYNFMLGSGVQKPGHRITMHLCSPLSISEYFLKGCC